MGRWRRTRRRCGEGGPGRRLRDTAMGLFYASGDVVEGEPGQLTVGFAVFAASLNSLAGASGVQAASKKMRVVGQMSGGRLSNQSRVSRQPGPGDLNCMFK